MIEARPLGVAALVLASACLSIPAPTTSSPDVDTDADTDADGHAVRACCQDVGCSIHTSMVSPTLEVGDVYRGEGSVRSDDVGRAMLAILRTRTIAEESLEHAPSDPAAPLDDWQPLTVSLEIEEAASAELELSFRPEPDSGGYCFVLDDVCLTREPSAR
jgi:hypothetical protein